MATTGYKKWSVRFDEEKEAFSLFHDDHGCVLKDVRIASVTTCPEPQYWPGGYGRPRASVSNAFDSSVLAVGYSGQKIDRRGVGVVFRLNDKGASIVVDCEGSAKTVLTGLIHFGDHDQRETMACRYNGQGASLRAAYGPAAGARDSALFDRDTDSLLFFATKGNFSLSYDWAEEAWRFTYDTACADYGKRLAVSLTEKAYERALGYDYKVLDRASTFPTPPVGWMTWYAVLFDACEESVLRNAAWQAEHLKKYGANTVWVDWEWYHPNHSGITPEGTDMFHPDPDSYPHGLAYVAEKIRGMGMIPALWIGPTCDGNYNEEMKAHPDAVLVHTVQWSGQYFFDVTHPAFLNEILPRMAGQAKEWGYDAVKWDVLPLTAAMCDQYRDDRFDPAVSTRTAMLRAFRKVREVLGEHTYMLACSGGTEKTMDMAIPVFNAARVGGDVFRWETFVDECVKKICLDYALHTVVINNDPDNLIVRPQFNTYDEAVSRASFVSLLGLPMTLGDDLPALPEDRVDILRRTIPPLPAHPMDIRMLRQSGKTLLINVAVALPGRQYNLIDVMNLDDEETQVCLTPDGDMDLEKGLYHVYDYWRGEYIGCVDAIEAELRAHESRVFAVARDEGTLQLISTSRHVSQGAMDVLKMELSADGKILSGASRVIGGDEYSLVIACPEGCAILQNGTDAEKVEQLSPRAYRLSWYPREDGVLAWRAAFTAAPDPTRG